MDEDIVKDTDIIKEEVKEVKEENKDLMKINYSYPDPSNENLQYNIYKKREFYYHKIPERPNVDDYNDIKEYRDNICARNFTLHEHQAMLSNFINPDTPYKGIVIFHGLGTGKCVHKDTNIYINNVLKQISNIWNDEITDIYLDNENGEWSKPKNKLFVLSQENNLIVEKQVLQLYREKVKTYMKHITLENNETIIITEIHKLLTVAGWNNNLFVDTSIATYNKYRNNIQYYKIISIKYIEYDDYVYDLEVEETHNYIGNNILCHNTCVGIAIAEKFKAMVQKYNTKILILVSGPLIKENWKQHLLKCTGETYLKYQDKSIYIDDAEKKRLEKMALMQALQHYKFMSYRSFYKHVLGEKIVDKKLVNDTKIKVSYRKTDEGEFERDISVDRMYNLNNTLIVVDEAHNLTGNAYGEALTHIIENSVNLKVVLMSGTPMKNLADDIIELVNFIRPQNNLIERDKIFTNDKNHTMEFKSGGKEYLKVMLKGYISHVRGADPLTFATRIDKGVKPDGLLFTKLIRCTMLDLQKRTYDQAIKEQDDALDRRSEAVANFVFPGLSKDNKELEGYYGREGINIVKNQLKTNEILLNKKISQELFGHTGVKELLQITRDGKTITGKILQLQYLKYFSTKFYKSLKKINRLVYGKKGVKSVFIYSNLVKVGIELYQEILLQNGYLEYQENTANYSIQDNTVCYFCGKTYKNHTLQDTDSKLVSDTDTDTDTDTVSDTDTDTDTDTEKPKLTRDIKDPDIELLTDDSITDKTQDTKLLNKKINISDSSSDYKQYTRPKNPKLIPEHKFLPATYITVTGKSTEESADMIPEDKKRILDNVFNSLENKDGKMIKIVLGSKVMNEGLSLRHIGEVHILDVYFNLGKVDQVVGRGIRHCSHYKLMNEENVYPFVNVYKYVVSLNSGQTGLTTEEDLYKKAELKYILVKKVERIMKEVAIDCPLNVHGNMFKEEMEKFKNCNRGDMKGNTKDGIELCPTLCDYTTCDYKCDDSLLNAEYYDPERKIYKRVPKDKIDYSTFTHGLARNEINYAKDKIKEMYILKYMYVLEDILSYIKESYDEDKKELFDEFFVFKALDELLPITENDFNTFKDTIIDKHNRTGYLIYVNKYYIFQPLDQNENVPMYYRTTQSHNISQQISLYNYLKNNPQYQLIKETLITKPDTNDTTQDTKDTYYNFKDGLEYYDARDEYEYVGYIDKELSRRKTKTSEEIKDVFKLREKRAKILDKKRGTGIPSLQGAVCSTAKNKQYLENVAKQLKIDTEHLSTRNDICKKIEEEMLYLEKYSTKKDGNKLTYVMIPVNHPVYEFPYNLEDRVEFIVNKITSLIKFKLHITTKQKTSKKGEHSYVITIKNDPKLKDYEKNLLKLNAKKEKDEWIIIVN
jgi:hypothetical protein